MARKRRDELAPPAPADLAAAPVLGAELAGARRYAEAASAPNTRRAYAADWRRFVTWCAGRSLDPEDALPALVAVYLATMADDGRPAPTIERAFAGVAAHLRASSPDAWPSGRRPPACAAVLRGIRREGSHRVTGKAPVVLPELDRMLAACGDGLAGMRNRALLLVGWAGAMRRAELVGLDVEHLTFETEGLRIVVPRSKTDQGGRGFEKGIAMGSTAGRCPVRALRLWIASAAVAAGPVFRRVNKAGDVLEGRLGDRAVALVIKSAAKAAGLPWAQYAGHSLRAGFVTEAARAHKPLDAIARQTNHRNLGTLLRYIRHATLFDENASEGLL